jgi:hypothetical protein
MKFSIKGITGKTTYLDMDVNSTVKQVKDKFEEKEGVPSYCQRLLFQNKIRPMTELKDNIQTLHDIGLIENAEMHMIIAYREDPVVVEQRKRDEIIAKESREMRIKEISKRNDIILNSSMENNETNVLLTELFHQISNIGLKNVDIDLCEKILDIEEKIIKINSKLK